MHSKRIGQFIIFALVLVGLYFIYSYVRGEMLSNVTRTDVVTSGLVAHYTFDGKSMDSTQTTSEVRDQMGTYHGDMIITAGTFATTSYDAEDATVVFNGEGTGDRFGISVASAGDVNADGYDDLIGGADSADGWKGRAYIFFGPFTSTSSINVENADVVLNGQDGSDWFGRVVASAGDVNRDGYDDVIVGAYDAEDGDVSCTAGTGDCGAAYIFFGPMAGTTTIHAQMADVIFNGESDDDSFGWFVDGVGDVNGDQYDDVAITAYGMDGDGTNRGAVYLYYGPLRPGSVDAEDADVIFVGKNDNDWFGDSVAGGDVTNDGISDIVIGAESAEDSGGACGGISTSNCGAAYLFEGPFTGTSTIHANMADVVFNGTSDGDHFGYSVYIADDVNADGYGDIVAGADDADENGCTSNCGISYLFYGPFTGTTSVNAENADVRFFGTDTNDWFGFTVAGAGDVNNDGSEDILVGASGASDTGSTRGRGYLFLGPFTGTTSIAAASADVIFNGAVDLDEFALSVAPAGDVNADGYADIFIGAYDAEDNDGATCTGSCGISYLFMPYTYGSKEVSGKIGQALQFDGSTGYVDVGNVGGVQSFSFWIKPDDVTDRPLVALNGSAVIELDSQGAVTATNFSAPTVYVNQSTSATTTQKGEWYHVVVTNTSTLDASDLRIGTDDTNYFKGSIDDFRVYNRVLSTDEIKRLYLLGNTMQVNKTRIGYDPTDPLVRGLAAHYSFDGPTISGTTVQDIDPYPQSTMGTTSYHVELADVIVNGETDSDNFGNGVAFVGDVNGDGIDDYAVGAPNGGAGAAYVFYGSSSPVSSIDAENADVVIDGITSGDYFGTSVSSAGDINNDGFSDIAVGAEWVDVGGGLYPGLVYIFYGGSLSASMSASNADVVITGATDGDEFGTWFSDVGDVNGDGVGDILIGATGYDNYDAQGRVYLFYGGALAASLSANDADVIITGTASGDRFGRSMASGDVNGDGYDDIIVGAFRASDTGTDRGRAYVFYGGSLASTIAAASADVIINGTTDGDYFGISVATGDINNDTYADVIVGANYATDAGTARGRAYVFYGGSLAASINAESADAPLNGTTDSDLFGWVVSSGDIDSDGTDDVIVGANLAEDAGTSRGRAYVFYGGALASEGTWAQNADVILNGTTDSDNFGWSLDAGQDVNNDGYSDILIGAYKASDTGTNRGRAYLFTPYATGTYDGTAVGAVPATGKIGQGFYFDGNNDYVRTHTNINDAADYNRFSVSLWVKPTDNSGNTEVNSGYLPGIFQDYESYMWISNGSYSSNDRIWMGVFGGAPYQIGIPYELNEWVHIGMVHAGGVLYAYKNGSLYTSIPTATIGGNGEIEMGRNGWQSQYFKGYIDDARLFNREVSADEMRQLYLIGGSLKVNTTARPQSATIVPDDRLIAHYTFDGSTIQGAYATTTDANLNKLGTFGTTSFDAEDADLTSFGTTNGDWFGHSVSSAGDVNGDGYDDILVGAYNGNAGGTATTGKAYLFFGSFTGTSSINAENADVVLLGEADFDRFGYSVSSAGDINADGYDDILVGSDGATDLGTNRGRAYLFLGPLTGTTSIEAQNADVIFNGEVDSDLFGESVSGAGDVNADGYADILVGALFAEDGGNCTTACGLSYLFFGPFTGTTSVHAQNADVIFNGEENDDKFGQNVSGSGDINGDGYDDIMVAASYAVDGGSCTTECGRSYLFFGPFTGTTSIDAQNADVVFNGEADVDRFGHSITSKGDVNGDGYDDLLIGAPYAEDGGDCTDSCGRSYLFLGPFTGTTSIDAENADVVFNGETDLDIFGWSVAFAGDANGDGYDDILVGASAAEDGVGCTAFCSLAYLFYGPFTSTTSIDAQNADVIFNGEANWDQFGYSVSGAGDVNADGYADLLIGANLAEDSGGSCTDALQDNCGAAYLFTPYADSKDASMTNVTPTSGKMGQAMDFNGTDSEVNVGDVGGVKTITFWLKADNLVSKDVLSIDASNDVYIDASGNVTMYVASGDGSYYVDAITGDRGISKEWHFVAITLESQNLSATDLMFGTATYHTNFYDGALDDIRLYNYVLTQEEVEAIYKAGGGTRAIKQSTYSGA